MDYTRALFIKLLWIKRRRESPWRACIAWEWTRRWVYRTIWLMMKIRFGIERAALTIFLIFLSRMTFLKGIGSLTLLESRTDRVLTRWLLIKGVRINRSVWFGTRYDSIHVFLRLTCVIWTYRYQRHLSMYVFRL